MSELRNTEAMRRLGLRLPVVQGPFGGGLSTVQLAAAVANRGGLGSYGAHYLEPDDLMRVTREIRSATDGAFAMNLWISAHDEGGQQLSEQQFERAWRVFAPYFAELGVERPSPPPHYHPDYEQQIEALLEAAPPVFSFVFGVPSPEVLAACRKRDIVTVGAATSIAEAVALEAAGIDLIVATGFEAGGHRPSFLARAEDSLMGTFVLTQLLSRRVKIPVIAAGGIVDARGVQAALTLGAQAAQMGTAFLACEESAASPAHRNALFSPAAEHTTLTRTFTGRLARGLRNRWTQELAGRVDDLPPYPITGWFLSKLRPAALASGHTELMSQWSGQIAPNLQHRDVAALMQALTEDLSAPRSA